MLPEAAELYYREYSGAFMSVKLMIFLIKKTILLNFFKIGEPIFNIILFMYYYLDQIYIKKQL